MMLNYKNFFVLLLLVAAVSTLSSCAPKKVRIYGAPDAIRADIVRLALSLQGAPYRSGAKGPDKFDCSGLVYYVYGRSRVSLPLTVSAQGRVGAEITWRSVQPGDLVMFKIGRDDHVGIMVNRVDFVHASSSRGVVVDSMNSPYWKRHFTGFRSVI